MASYTTVADWRDVEGSYVVDVTIRQTGDDQYPSGWDYSLHIGEVGGDAVLRYDNAHERTKGHERHTETPSNGSSSPGCSHSTTGSKERRKR
jgi:hypothetical protein